MASALESIATARQPSHDARMQKRATKRPAGFTKPDHWTNDPPPAPASAKDDEELSPTRYGDWVRDGIAVDF